MAGPLPARAGPNIILLALALALGAGLAAQEPGGAGEAVPPGAPLSLAAALQRVRSVSLDVALKRLELLRSRAAVDEARSRLAPRLSLSASASYLANPPEGIAIKQGSLGSAPAPGSEYPLPFPDQDIVLLEDTRNSYFQLGADFSLPLYTGGKLEGAVKAAQAGGSAAQAAMRAAERQAEAGLKGAWLGALVSSASADFLSRMEGLLAERLATEEGNYAEGLVTLQDLLASRSELARARSQKLRAQEGLSTALAALAFLLDLPSLSLSGLEGGMELFIAEEPPFPEDEDPAALEARLRADSPDREELAAKLVMAESLVSIRAASRPLRPDLALSGSLGLSGQHIPLLQGNWTDSWDWSLILSLGGKLGLYDGGEAEAALAQARAQAEMARRGLAEYDRSVSLSVRRAVEAARTARALLEEKEAALAYALEREKNARVSRENDLLTEKDERAAIAARLAAELERQMALLELGRALIDLEALCPPPAAGAAVP